MDFIESMIEGGVEAIINMIPRFLGFCGELLASFMGG